jgi:hypothetical protein
VSSGTRPPLSIAKKGDRNIAFRQTNNGVSALSRVYGNWAWRAGLQETMNYMDKLVYF